MKQKLFSWGDDFTIKDAEGREVYLVDGKAFSIGAKLSFQDLSGQVQSLLNGETGLTGELEATKSKVRETARDFIANATGRRPMIIPVVLEE